MSRLPQIRPAQITGCQQPLQQCVLRGNRPEEPLLAAQLGLNWSREYER
jgi:hypothetical protein